MNRSVPLLILIFFMVSGCSRNVVSSTSPPVVPPVVQPYPVTNEYDAAYYGNNGSIYYTYAYHIKDTLYDGSGGGYHWSSLSRNATDTFYNLAGQSDAPFGQNKSCVALISNIDTSQQKNYSYYIGSYYKFSLFNDTTVGNLQFMIPTDSFPSVDSIPVGHFLNFYGGLQSFYTRMARAEVKITSGQDFVQT
ncbi:MAG TPA: hypothetical protein DIC22_07225, partial [Chitinophagaceae bacterium]|nr:hypothetical protein [Chitinophagaceae bacterium]